MHRPSALTWRTMVWSPIWRWSRRRPAPRIPGHWSLTSLTRSRACSSTTASITTVRKSYSQSSLSHAKARSLVIVGHNPSLHEFALQLINSGDVQVREQLHDNLPTSGLVVMDLPIDEWPQARPHAA